MTDRISCTSDARGTWLALLVFLLSPACLGALEPGPGNGGSPGPDSVRGQGAPSVTSRQDPGGPAPGQGASGPPGAAPDKEPGPPAREPTAPSTGFVCDPKAVPSAPARLWRLTDRQYAAAVAVVLGGRSRDANRDLAIPSGIPYPFGFVNENDRWSTIATSYTMEDLSLRSAMAAAERVAERVVAALAGSCLDKGGALQPCLESLISEKGALLFSRPLLPDEFRKYAALATRLEPMVGRKAAAQHAFEALMMAPQFLFRAELGGAASGRLTPYEIAAALSYGLTDGPPDEALWRDAVSGAISEPATIEAHVERLLGADMTSPPLARFLREYFRYEATRDVAKDESFHDPDALIRDTDAFLQEVLTSAGRGKFLERLLTSPVGFVSKASAASYGRSSTSAAPERVTFADGQRYGILTQPSWLTSYSQPEMNDPIRRGRFVMESLLCGHVPEVTIEEIPQIPTDPNRTLRERLGLHTENPTCKGCHALMDPIGLAFEGYDHLGRPRSTEAGKPVNTSGVLMGSGDQDGAFPDLGELVRRLSKSRQVTECFVSHSFTYWSGRAAAAGDACTLARARDAYESSGGDLAKLLKTLFTADSFLVRKI